MKRKTKILLVVLIGVLLFVNLIAIILIFKPSGSGMSGFSVLNQEDKVGEESQQGSEPEEEITTPAITSRSSGGGGGSSGGGSSGGGSGGSPGGGGDGGESCQNECSSGQTRCSGNILESCNDQDGDGCLEWEEEETCEYGCENGHCIASYKADIFVSSYNGNKGQEFTITINVSSGGEIYAGQFYLWFNSSILEALDIAEGNFLKQDGAGTSFPIGVTINNSLGKIGFANTRLVVEKGVTGEGSLAIVNFKAKSSGSTTLNLENVKIVNPELQEINVSLVNGKVVVS